MSTTKTNTLSDWVAALEAKGLKDQAEGQRRLPRAVPSP